MDIKPINNTNFSALYKIETKSVSEQVEKLIKSRKYPCVPSSHIAPEYYYVLTPDNKRSEKTFEKAMSETGGKFWKSLSFKNVLNKNIAEEVFNRTKAMQNGENWVEGEAKYLDIQF